jgi:hypothetical protein
MEQHLLRLEAAMRSFMIIVLLIAVAALALSLHDAAVSPAASAPATTPSPTSIAGTRMLLLPDGEVEVTDVLARRVFRWDGQRWLEHEASVASP